MIKFLYKNVLKPILFKFDPELVHDVFVDMGEWLGNSKLGRGFISQIYQYKGDYISKTVDGITYKYPVMLAAGFDYNGRLSQCTWRRGFWKSKTPQAFNGKINHRST